MPDPHTVDLSAEPAEEGAYTAMAAEKARLRAHIEAAYGVTVEELARLTNG